MKANLNIVWRYNKNKLNPVVFIFKQQFVYSKSLTSQKSNKKSLLEEEA